MKRRYYKRSILFIFIVLLLFSSIQYTNGKIDDKNKCDIQNTNLVFEELFQIENTGGDTFETQVVDEFLFVMDMVGELQVYDIEDASNPVLVDEFDDGGIGHNMHIVGDLLYLADHYQGLEIYNITDPNSISKIGQITDDADGEIDGVYVSENIAYVSEWHDSSRSWSMKIINVTDSTNPELLNEYTDDDNEFIRFFVRDDICFVSCLNSGFKILNVSDPTNVQELARLENCNAFNFKIVGDTAFLADSSLGLRILDVSDVTNIVQIGNYSTLQPTFGLDIHGDMAFLGEHETGLLVLNITDFTNPQKIIEYAAYNIVGVTYQNDIIFLSMHTDGLVALKIVSTESSNSSLFLFGIITGVLFTVYLITKKKRTHKK